MTEQEQFTAFLESLRTEDNSMTIDTIMEGYEACFEAGLVKKLGKAAMPYIAAAGIAGGAAATGALDDSDLIKYKQEEQAKMKYSNQDLSNIIKSHEAAIKSGDKEARAKAYDAVKAANLKVGFDKANNFKFYWDNNLGRAFYPDGSEVPAEDRQYLPSFN